MNRLRRQGKSFRVVESRWKTSEVKPIVKEKMKEGFDVAVTMGPTGGFAIGVRKSPNKVGSLYETGNKIFELNEIDAL